LTAWETSAAIWSSIRAEARRLAPGAQRASRIAPAASSRQRWRSRIAFSCESSRAVIVSATRCMDARRSTESAGSRATESTTERSARMSSRILHEELRLRDPDHAGVVTAHRAR
jgi:hypothetical protein